MKDEIVIIIPAYNPTNILLELVENLNKNGYKKIIVINDGSKSEEIFRKLGKKTIILTHKNNQGKGNALKTGFNYCIKNFKNKNGIITVDSDGQHLIKDINNVYNKQIENPNKIILGSRNFEKTKIPFRSLFGNKIIRWMFKQKTKIKINDTQTGLRAIPFEYLENFCQIKGNRFEYEINMLIYAAKKGIHIMEETIETVYINKNKMSNFHIIKDSIRIAYNIIKFKLD